MPANFRPEMSVIKDLKPFKFWCSKVLPTVYDDSLSYYELLTKVLRYLNDTMESVEALDGNVNNIYNAYLLLEDYVNNYFDNADFQQMVNDKLDEMAEDGTLTTLITTYVDPLFDQMTEDLDTAIENQNTLIDGRFNTQDTRLGVMESQMNEFIADHAGPAMAFTLWSGYADAVGTNITLSDDPANYDYIEVYLRTVGSSYCPSIHRFPADSFHSTPNLSVVQTEIGNNTNDTRLNEYRINIEPTDSVDATKYRIRYSNHWLWVGTTDSDAVNYENNISDEQEASAGIVKIVGIKNVQNNAEVIDARIGANNQTYTTLGDAIRSQVTNLQSAINNIQIKDELKQAFLGLADAVGYKNDEIGNTVRNNLYHALYDVNVTSITATFVQGTNVIYDDDSLDELKQYLTVTAFYDDGTSGVVTSYTLSGTLTVGTSTITVTYNEVSTTFNVTVSAGIPSGYTVYDYMQVANNNAVISAIPASWITLKEYDNLDELSWKLEFSALTGYVQGSALIGARMDSGVTTGDAVYIGSSNSSAIGASDRSRMIAHGVSTVYSSNAIMLGAVNTLIFTNTSASPSEFAFNGVPTELPWETTLTVTRGLTLFANPTPTSETMTLQRYLRMGALKLYDLSGNLVGDYLPCVRNSDTRIGMFDRVTQTFFTSSTAIYTTVGNTSCYYTVGNWS